MLAMCRRQRPCCASWARCRFCCARCGVAPGARTLRSRTPCCRSSSTSSPCARRPHFPALCLASRRVERTLCCVAPLQLRWDHVAGCSPSDMPCCRDEAACGQARLQDAATLLTLVLQQVCLWSIGSQHDACLTLRKVSEGRHSILLIDWHTGAGGGGVDAQAEPRRPRGGGAAAAARPLRAGGG